MKSLASHAVTAAAVLSSADIVTASILRPPVLPLTVRTPYLSTWLANARDDPWQSWPMFYTGETVGLSIMAMLPQASSVYPLLGRPHDSLRPDASSYTIRYPEYRGVQFDASTTNLSYTLQHPSEHRSAAEITISFLSPITPTSTLRQAIPASYIHITVQGSLSVAVYIDVNGQWVSGSQESIIEWQLRNSSHKGEQSIKSWSVRPRTEQLFTETNDRAEWGNLILTAPLGVAHEAGSSVSLREGFARNATLRNTTDKYYRSVMQKEPVFAFAKTFGQPNASAAHESQSWYDSVLFTLAHIQDPIVQFASSDGLESMSPMWLSHFPSSEELVSYHFNDFRNAVSLAATYSSQLNQDAIAYAGDQYADIVALSARQVLGATSFAGSPVRPLIFLKEISSNGNSQTVDIIFPAAPFFLYTNPSWLTYLLEPLLDHQLSGQYPNSYSMHDLGAHFPNLTGHTDGRDEYMPVEESGDMVILSLALVHALQSASKDKTNRHWRLSGAGSGLTVQGTFALTIDGEGNDLDDEPMDMVGHGVADSWMKRSWPLWQQWTEYLIDYSLEPQNQLCTDDFAGELPLQSNLALKGIIGIRAMSELASLINEEADHRYYRNISDTYARKWQDFAISRDKKRVKLAYDWQGSWTTLYSLYADALLCFHPARNGSLDTTPPSRTQVPVNGQAGNTGNFLPHALYELQSRWYPTAMQKYGLPLDSRHLYAKSDWELQAAAVAMPETRRQIIERVALWVNETKTDRPLSDLYITEGDGGFPGPNFFARPVVGSHFAPLVLERACDGHGADPFESD